MGKTKLSSTASSTAVGATAALLFSSFAFSQTVSAPQLDGAAIRTRLARTWDPPGRADPGDSAQLDAMFQKKDFGPLAARLKSARTAQDLELDMNWEQTKVFNGAGFIVSYAYMYDLWRFGSALPPAQGDGLKQSAAMVFLYNVDLITLDGSKCLDASAPGHRLDQLFNQNKELIQYLRTLPRSTRMMLGTVSLDVELATAPLRQDDAVLCSGGMAQITASLKAQGDKPMSQRPNAPGMIGKTYALPPAPDYTPQFVSVDLWGPKQAKTREAMPTMLTHLLTVPGDAQPPSLVK